MQNEKLVPISIIILAAAILVSSIIIAGGMGNPSVSSPPNLQSIADGLNGIGSTLSSMNSNADQDVHLNLSNAAALMGLSPDQVVAIIKKPDSGLPYIKHGAHNFAALVWKSKTPYLPDLFGHFIRKKDQPFLTGPFKARVFYSVQIQQFMEPA